MSIYSLTLPTLSLLLNIAQLGIPTTISKLIAKKKHSTFKIMQNSFLMLMIIDLIVGILYIFLVPTIASNYLKNDLTKLTLYGMVFLIPIISLTSLLKGYYIGIDKVNVTNKCQISEEITRLLFIVIFVDSVDKNNVSFLSFFAMLSSIIGEIASLIHLLVNIKEKNKNIIKRIKTNNENNKIISSKIIKLSIMSTSTKMVGSVIYFLEPIIYTYLMLSLNVSNEKLTIDYGIINSYVFPLLTLPSFFSNCVSIFLLPKLSKLIENKDFKNSIKIFLFSLLFCLITGFVCILIIYLYPKFFTNLLYGKIIGIEYIKKYSFLILVLFIQPIIHVTLICFDKEKLLLIESIICNIVKIICFYIFIPLFKIDGMVISILISLYLSVVIHIYSIIKNFYHLKQK